VAAGQVPDLVGRVTGVVSQLEGVGEGADDAIALVSLVVGRVEVQSTGSSALSDGSAGLSMLSTRSWHGST